MPQSFNSFKTIQLAIFFLSASPFFLCSECVACAMISHLCRLQFIGKERPYVGNWDRNVADSGVERWKGLFRVYVFSFNKKLTSELFQLLAIRPLYVCYLSGLNSFDERWATSPSIAASNFPSKKASFYCLFHWPMISVRHFHQNAILTEMSNYYYFTMRVRFLFVFTVVEPVLCKISLSFVIISSLCVHFFCFFGYFVQRNIYARLITNWSSWKSSTC